MKLIIDIPIDRYKQIRNEQWLPNRLDIENAIANGIPLERVREEIADEKIDIDLDIGQEIHYNRAIDDVLNLIDKYTKGAEDDNRGTEESTKAV